MKTINEGFYGQCHSCNFKGVIRWFPTDCERSKRKMLCESCEEIEEKKLEEEGIGNEILEILEQDNKPYSDKAIKKAADKVIDLVDRTIPKQPEFPSPFSKPSLMVRIIRCLPKIILFFLGPIAELLGYVVGYTLGFVFWTDRGFKLFLRKKAERNMFYILLILCLFLIWLNVLRRLQ